MKLPFGLRGASWLPLASHNPLHRPPMFLESSKFPPGRSIPGPAKSSLPSIAYPLKKVVATSDASKGYWDRSAVCDTHLQVRLAIGLAVVLNPSSSGPSYWSQRSIRSQAGPSLSSP